MIISQFFVVLNLQVITGGFFMSEKKKKDNRNRNWTFIVYPESAPENWYQILQDKMLNFAVSPLHDVDILESETGEVKKAHYHVLLCFSGNKSFEQIKGLDKFLRTICYCVVVQNQKKKINLGEKGEIKYRFKALKSILRAFYFFLYNFYRLIFKICLNSF